jgi:intracellular multiplication protein IcmM
MFSLGLNLVLMSLIYFAYMQIKAPAFYATDGVRAPILLHALPTPNRTSTFLLPPDPVSEDTGVRPIPE